MEKECLYCGKLIEFEKHQQFGGHLTNCDKNPKRQEILRKSAESRKIEIKKYSLICKKCGANYEIELKTTEFKKGRYAKNCSRKCSNSKTHSEETRMKMSNSLKEYYEKNSEKIAILRPKKEKNKCKICGKTVKKLENVYCSVECAHKCDEFRNKISISQIGKNSGEKNGMFGKPPSHKKYMGGFFYSVKNNKQIHYRSSYELKAMEILEKDLNVYSYNYEPYSIKYRNGKRSTIIDFEIFYIDKNKKIVEVKPTRLINKWNNNEKIQAVKEYCEKNKILFEVWSEKELNIK